MKHLIPLKLTILTGLAAATSVETACATGFRLPDQDAFATARGEAFVATADNPSAIYYNPAGITQLDGSNVRGGVYGIYLDPTYKAPGGSTTYHNSDNYAAIPQLFYTYTFKEAPVSLGLGVYSPYGLSLKWPQDAPFRSDAIQGSLKYYTVNPVVAYKLPWNISLAAGLMVNYSTINLGQGVTPYPDNDLFGFRGDAWAVGYNLGLMWQPIKKISIGATFRSSTQMDYRGHTTTEFNNVLPSTESPAGANFPLPFQVSSGISFRPTEKWNLEFDAEYTDWSTVGNLTIKQATVNPLLGTANVPFPLDWESSWYYEFGATRYFDNGWHVSAGYIFNENSVPNAHYTPYVTDMDRHFASIGTGYKGQHFSFDVAYQLGIGPDHTVTGDSNPTADGTYSFFSSAVSVSCGWHF